MFRNTNSSETLEPLLSMDCFVVSDKTQVLAEAITGAKRTAREQADKTWHMFEGDR